MTRTDERFQQPVPVLLANDQLLSTHPTPVSSYLLIITNEFVRQNAQPMKHKLSRLPKNEIKLCVVGYLLIYFITWFHPVKKPQPKYTRTIPVSFSPSISSFQGSQPQLIICICFNPSQTFSTVTPCSRFLHVCSILKKWVDDCVIIISENLFSYEKISRYLFTMQYNKLYSSENPKKNKTQRCHQTGILSSKKNNKSQT